MATKGKSRGRGRGRGKAKVIDEIENGNVPELDEPPPPVVCTPIRQSVRLNSVTHAVKEESEADDDDEVQELALDESSESNDLNKDESMDASSDAIENGAMETQELQDIQGSEDNSLDKADSTMEDTEMVSEDELFTENKEPLDTEAVSDEELREESQGLPETEAVSDDELPEEKRRKAKVAEAEAVSEDELPDEGDKKQNNVPEPAKSEEEETGAKVDGKRKLPEGEYDPNSPTSENSDGGPAAKKPAISDGKSPTPKQPKPLPELEKYWKTVKDDPSDFTGWTYLLQYVDQENEIETAREAYDAFLAHYPYCYGYWRKFADFEKRKGHVEQCEQVFERGLKAIPLSVDLWLHYLNYCKAAHPDDKDLVRSQYERAIAACGLEFRSDRLWESYIKWEKEKKNLIEITNLYDRLLAIPTQGYTTHFDAFQELVNQNPPQTIVPVDDFLDLRREVLSELKKNKTAVSAVPGEEAPPGDDADGDDEEDSGASVTARMEEETSALREKIIASRRKLHKTTVAAVAARWNYEEGIKRPYFHVKPLERCQLKNWKEYLEYEIEQGDHNRIITLFERCLIACALYEEFWVRFIRYLETIPGDQTEKIRDVYERACTIHHKKKPNLHLQWSVFEETAGSFEKASTILENVEATTPNLLQVAYRRINLERRRGRFSEAAQLYEEYISLNKSKAIIVTNMTVKYARFTWKFLNDIDKAIEILDKALENDKDNTRLYLQLIDMGLQKSPVDEVRILTILNLFLEKEGDIEQKLMFSQRKIEFLEDFGSNIESVQNAQDEFQKYVKQVKEKKKKTEAEPTTPTTTTVTTSKKAKAESTAAAATPPVPTASVPNAPPPSPAAPPSGYPPSGYPPNYYGQYPPPTGDQSSYPNNYPASGYNNYSNWNYQQGNYGNYQQTGWPGYYPNY